MEVKIRDVDPAAISKIDEIAKKKNISRNEYLKRCIEQYSILPELASTEDKYTELVELLSERLDQANDVLMENSRLLEKISSRYE